MKRNKKNTAIDAAAPKVRKSGSAGTDVNVGATADATEATEQKIPAEINGPKGPEPTRYGDWEQKGRCTDF